MKDGVPLKPNASACALLRARMASIALALPVRSRLETIHVDAGGGQQLVETRLGQLGRDADHRLMRLDELVLILGGERHPRGDLRDLAQDRPVLQHQADLAVVLHHLP